VRLWWGRVAEARLREALEPIVAAGDPVNGRQLNLGPLAQEDNAAAYLRQARAHERADWGTRMARPAVATMLPYLNGTRHLANTLGDAAEYAHFRGDDAAALETIRDVRGLAR